MFQGNSYPKDKQKTENWLRMLHPSVESVVFLGGAFEEILIFIPANLTSSRYFKQVRQTRQHSFVLMSPSIYKHILAKGAWFFHLQNFPPTKTANKKSPKSPQNFKTP